MTQIDYGHIPEKCRHSEVAAELRKRDREISRLRSTLSLIAHCDDPEHPDFESHGLYRSMMILMAKNALKAKPSHDD